MLIVLPPSEGKTAPTRGRPLDLDTLSLADGLTDTRRRVLDALEHLCRTDRETAIRALDLGPTQTEAVDRNADLARAPTARAERVYTGVLYAALDLPGLDAATRRRAARSVVTASALFGLVRPGDRIPAYRLSGDTRLPGLGPVASSWREPLGAVVPELVGDGLLVDLRSQAYVPMFRPTGALAARTAGVRVLHELAGRRAVVSHVNKATKGRLVRSMLTGGVRARTVTGLADALRDLGWTVELVGRRLDVVVNEL